MIFLGIFLVIAILIGTISSVLLLVLMLQVLMGRVDVALLDSEITFSRVYSDFIMGKFQKGYFTQSTFLIDTKKKAELVHKGYWYGFIIGLVLFFIYLGVLIIKMGI